MKLYFKIAATALLAFATYGMIVPTLTSSHNSAACIVGALIAVLMPVPLVMLALWAWRDDAVQWLLKKAAALLPLMLLLAVAPSLGGCTSMCSGDTSGYVPFVSAAKK